MSDKPQSNTDLIKLWLAEQRTATWGRSFDLNNSADDAAAWFDGAMDSYFEWLEMYAFKQVAERIKERDNG